MSLAAQNDNSVQRAYFQHPVGVLVHGDCIQEMRRLPKECIDTIITDPPYGVNYQDRTGRSIANDVDLRWLKPAFTEMHRVLRNDSYAVCFYGFNRIAEFQAAWEQAGFRLAGPLAFVKDYASNKGKVSHTARCHENAVLLVKGRPQRSDSPPRDVYQFSYSGNKIHPTQKPLDTMQQLVEDFSEPGDIVLDPYGGSGTTCAAAALKGREFHYMELDPEFFGAAWQRLSRVKAVKAKPVQRQQPATSSNVTPLRKSA